MPSRLFSTSVFAAPPLPRDQVCNQLPAAARMQEKIVKDLRARVVAEASGLNAYSFHFTDAWRIGSNPNALAVYFETLGDKESSRRARVAQYTIDEKTCEPTFTKWQPLIGGKDASPDRLNGINDKEICNFGEGQQKIISSADRDMKWLYGSMMPGSTIGNYSFTGVSRVANSADVIAVLEIKRADLLSYPVLLQIDVDPKTCEGKFRASTNFTSLYVQY